MDEPAPTSSFAALGQGTWWVDVEDRPHRLAEGIAPGVADRPEAEREAVLRSGGEGVVSGSHAGSL